MIRTKQIFDLIELQSKIKSKMKFNGVDYHKKKIFVLGYFRSNWKNFLIVLVLAKGSSQNKIAFTLASSGIVTSLLRDGRTSH